MAKKLIISKGGKVGGVKTPCKSAPKKQAGTLSEGEVVIYNQKGIPLVGVIKKNLASNTASIELTLPDGAGVHHRIGSEIIVPTSDLKKASNLVSEKRRLVKEWDAHFALDSKEPTAIYEHPDKSDAERGRIVDYRDVTISGYLSTFVGVTPQDRDGDYVVDGAFDKSLARFRENPVMLIDHMRSVETLAGHFTKLGVDDKGLAVEGLISNAPGLIDTRFKVAEGHLKTLSMGGFFLYDDDGRGILEVDLFEGSLVPVPANPDAQFMVRQLTAAGVAKAIARIHSKCLTF